MPDAPPKARPSFMLEDLASALPRHAALFGLDVGTKTIGVAISDVSRTIATAVGTIRRKKFTRNIGLMYADRRAYPDRTLGKFLWLRDLLHLSRYGIEQAGGRLTPEIVGYLEQAVTLYEKEFLGETSLYARDGMDYYSEALRILNRGFDAAWALGAGFNGASPGEPIRGRFSTVEAWRKTLSAWAGVLTEPFTGKYL